jgi:hypothetical protein
MSASSSLASDDAAAAASRCSAAPPHASSCIASDAPLPGPPRARLDGSWEGPGTARVARVRACVHVGLMLQGAPPCDMPAWRMHATPCAQPCWLPAQRTHAFAMPPGTRSYLQVGAPLSSPGLEARLLWCASWIVGLADCRPCAACAMAHPVRAVRWEVARQLARLGAACCSNGGPLTFEPSTFPRARGGVLAPPLAWYHAPGGLVSSPRPISACIRVLVRFSTRGSSLANLG